MAMVNYSQSNYKKYSEAELDPLIKDAMRSNGWPSEIIPTSIKFGMDKVHRCGKGLLFGYTAGDGALILYDYRNGGTTPVKISYSSFGIVSQVVTPEEIEEVGRKTEEKERQRQAAIKKAIGLANKFYEGINNSPLATPYTEQKQIKSFNGVRNNNTDLVIP